MGGGVQLGQEGGWVTVGANRWVGKREEAVRWARKQSKPSRLGTERRSLCRWVGSKTDDYVWVSKDVYLHLKLSNIYSCHLSNTPSNVVFSWQANLQERLSWWVHQ